MFDSAARLRTGAFVPFLLCGVVALSACRPFESGSSVTPDQVATIEAKARTVASRSGAFAELPRPFDDPRAAAEFAALKRRVHDDLPGDATDRLLAAQDSLAGRRLYSTRRSRFLTRGAGGLQHANGALGDELERWQSLGPGNIGGRTRSVLIDPTQPSTLYVSGVSGGIWKTSNGGSSWSPIADRLPNIAVSAMVMDPADPQVIYAGTGEGFLREVVRGTSLPLRGAGIWKTGNGGGSWSRLRSTRNRNFHWVNDLVVSSADSNRVYAATRTGVWRSLDAGASWSRIHAFERDGGCLDLALRTDRSSDELLVACGTLAQGAVFRSTAAEAGGSFEQVLTEGGMGRVSLAHAPSDQNVVYALAASHVPGPGGNFDGGLHAVFRSDSGGAAGSWSARVRNTDPQQLNTLLLSNAVIANLVRCGFGNSDSYINLGWYANVIAVDPIDPEVVFVGGVDLFRSDDGGRNWGLISYWWDGVSAHADQHVIAFDPGYDGAGNQRVYFGNDGGVWRSNNVRAATARGATASCDPGNTGVRGVRLNNGLGITQFYQGVPYPDGRRFVGGTQDNGTVRGSVGDGFNGWQRIHGGDGGYNAVDPNDPDIVYAETQWFGFVKSVDGGENFEDATNGVDEPALDFLFITPFVMDPSDPRRLWTGGRFLWRTDNGAAQWQRASSRVRDDGQVSALAVAPDDPNRVYVGLSNGWVHRSDRATSAGPATSWPASRPRDGFVSWLAVDPRDRDIVYATYAGFGGGAHVWKSVDGGVNWQSVDGSGDDRLPDIPVHSIVVDPVVEGRLFLGTDLGVFTSPDGGQRWAPENSGFGNMVTESLSLSLPPGGDPMLFAFTHGRGAWRVPLRASSGGTLALPSSIAGVNERVGEVRVEIARIGGTDGEVSVRLRTRSGSARSGEDFVAVSTTVNWSSGDGDPKTVVVELINDEDVEGTESFFVDLVDTTGGAELGLATAEVAILDNDVQAMPCDPTTGSACLNGGRYQVDVFWTDGTSSGGSNGQATASGLGSDDSELLWFFTPDNWEMLVKVLDGCAINGHVWVFSGASTDLGFNLRVTDTVAGDFRIYGSVAGQAARPIADVEAFVCDGPTGGPAETSLERSKVSAPNASPTGLSGADGAEGACLGGLGTLCLRDRFEVTARWRTAAGDSGSGTVAPVGTSESGLFWFFSDNNWEMLVKVLDGCALNDSFWVFAALTTDVEVTLDVTDRFTGQARTYVNPIGTLAPAITDTSAFATCSATPAD